MTQYEKIEEQGKTIWIPVASTDPKDTSKSANKGSTHSHCWSKKKRAIELLRVGKRYGERRNWW